MRPVNATETEFMKRTKVIVGCTFVVLAAACIGQVMLDQPGRNTQPQKPNQTPAAQEAQTQAQAETQPVSADEVVGTFLPSVKDGEEQSRLVALGGLLDVLD